MMRQFLDVLHQTIELPLAINFRARAAVGVQPFGGEGLSGTGPKAGSPWALMRYATERCVSIDTTSAGGNASLIASVDE